MSRPRDSARIKKDGAWQGNRISEPPDPRSQTHAPRPQLPARPVRKCNSGVALACELPFSDFRFGISATSLL